MFKIINRVLKYGILMVLTPGALGENFFRNPTAKPFTHFAAMTTNITLVSLLITWK